jgi:polygalacturonase
MIRNRIKKQAGKLLLPLCFCLAAPTIHAQEKTIEYYTAQAPFKMPVVKLPEIPAGIFNIKDYGAVGNGELLNTTAFAKAIAACQKAGGGTVVVPPGLWLTGPIQLQSNMALDVQRGAIIQFTADHSQYPMIKASTKSTSYVPASPIYGYDLKNIAIKGEGIIDGAGDSWRPVKKSKVTASQWKGFLAKKESVLSADGNIWWPNKEAMAGEAYLKKLKDSVEKPGAEAYLPAREFLRPYMVYLHNCEQVLVEGVTIRNSPKFVFYPNSSRDITMRYVNVFNEWWAQNGDAIDISACKNVVIYKCNVSAGDDGICLKSSGGKNKDTNEVALENILIAGCNVYHGHGGFVIGSNTDGNMNNVFAVDCSFIGTDVGIRVKSNAGRGGQVKNIYLRNISMSDIVDEAISFDTYYEDVPAGKEKTITAAQESKIPRFSDFYISDVYCKSAKKAIAITGLPQAPVTKIHFENMVIQADQGYENKNATEIEFKKVKLITPSGVKEL